LIIHTYSLKINLKKDIIIEEFFLHFKSILMDYLSILRLSRNFDFTNKIISPFKINQKTSVNPRSFEKFSNN